MNMKYIIICISLMAAVTYLPRVLPLVLFRKKLGDGFFKSFLKYMPYGVLAAMVFPGIFYSTSSPVSAVVGALIALVMSFFKMDLLPVAVCAVTGVYITEMFFC